MVRPRSLGPLRCYISPRQSSPRGAEPSAGSAAGTPHTTCPSINSASILHMHQREPARNPEGANSMAFVPQKVISSRHRRGVEAGTAGARLGLLIFLPVCVASVLPLTAHAAETAKALTAEDIRVLQEKYRQERTDAERSSAVKKFSPER